MRFVKCCFGLFLLLILIGCNAAQRTKLPENYTESLPGYAELNVPHISQNDNYSCATTSLAMVMSYYDEKRYSKSEVWEISGSSRAAVRTSGNDMAGLHRAAEHYGFMNREFIMGSTIDEIKYFISKGKPVIVNIRNFFQKSSHAVVISGYDKEGFFFADPASRLGRYKKDYKTFKNHWWANLSTPKGRQHKTAFIVHSK